MDKAQFQHLFTEFTNFKENGFHPLVWVNGEPEIGENVYIAGMSVINAKGAKVVIKDNCDIASFVSINCADSHKKSIGMQPDIERKDILIEENVFIGSHSVVKGGAHIGHHSVVAAGTIVDGVYIPPYSLVIGNPMTVKEGYYAAKHPDNNETVIPHNKPSLGSEEEKAVLRVIRSGWVAQGNEVKKFEDEVCTFLGIPEGQAVAVSSGTAALFLSLWALEVVGQPVAIPAYVCAALRNAVRMNGSHEVLIDSGFETPNMDFNQLQKSQVTTAIIPHMYGIPTDVTRLDGIRIVEDCAQSMGASINGKPVGLYGLIGVFSFYATKLITSGGQGGMLVSNDRSIIDKIRDFRQFDHRSDSMPRFNLQMTDLQAAVGREQLRKLPFFLKRREEIFNIYKTEGLPLLDVLQEDGDRVTPVRYRAILKVKNPLELINKFATKGIRVINPMEEWEVLGPSSEFKSSHTWSKSTLSLPIHPTLTDEEVQRIVSVSKEVIGS